MPVLLPWLDWPRLTLTIPKLAEVVPRLLDEATNRFELSTLGKIGVTIAQQSDIGTLLDLLVVESLTALKTERTEHFIKALDHRIPGRIPLYEAGEYEGKVLAGEAKVSATEFANEGQIRRDIELSRRLKADVHVMAAIDVIPGPLQEEAREHCGVAGLELLVLHEPDLRPRLAETRNERDRQAEHQARAQQRRR
ncbi:hypothetical protein [Streptomyces goshikiensis]